MKLWNAVLWHLLSGAVIVTGFPSALPVAAQEPAKSVVTERSDSHTQLDGLPDSPGVTRSSESQQSQSQASASTQSESGVAQTSQPQPQSSTSNSPQKPVGTAAAENPNASGIAASQPAGVAIAPAKQRRVRTIVLRMGAIAAAGVAVGTVAALSRGTSSKPPGAR